MNETWGKSRRGYKDDSYVIGYRCENRNSWAEKGGQGFWFAHVTNLGSIDAV